MDRPFQTPAGSQRLFDLCKYSNEQAKIGFFFVLNNTLVCQNLDKAREINNSQREKFRIVTMDGFTLLPNGSIQGGGQPKRGAVNTGILQQQSQANNQSSFDYYQLEVKKLGQMEEAIKNAVHDLGKLQQEFKELVQKKNLLPAMISNTEREIPKLTDILIMKRKKLQDMVQEKQDLTTGDQITSAKLIDELRHKNSNMENQKLELQLKIELQNNELNKILGEDYAELVKELEKMDEEKLSSQNKISKIEAELQNYSGQTEKKETQLLNLKKEVEKA